MADAGRVIERVLRSLAALTEAAEAILTREPGLKFGKTCDAHLDSLAGLGSAWERVNQRMQDAKEPFEKAACAKEWLIANFEKDAFAQMQALMDRIREQAAIITSGSTARGVAYMIAMYTMHTAFVLLRHASHTARLAIQYGNSSSSSGGGGGSARRISSSRRGNNYKAGKAVGQKAISALTHGDFISAVAGAFWAIHAINEGCRASERPSHGPAGGAEAVVLPSHDIHVAIAAGGLCRYTLIVTRLVHEQLHGSANAGGDAQAAATLPPGLVRIIEALADSQLLAAAAASVLYAPEIVAEEGPRKIITSGACTELHNAAKDVVEALVFHDSVCDKLKAAGPEGRRLAGALLRAVRHDAVCRLQVGLLDRLAVHAGLSARLEGEDGGDERSGVQEGQGDGGQPVAAQGEEREQQGEQEEQGQQGNQAEHGDGWGGRSGLWWVAREEERRGQLIPALDGEGNQRAGDEQQGPRGTAGGLGAYHNRVVAVTFGDWRAVEQLAAEAGVPAQPSPLLMARLRARAIASLCRLYRGEGLGGAYARVQARERLVIQAMASSCLPTEDEVALLPTDTARACLPHWLEAAGWVVALASDAVAAATGELPGAEHKGELHRLVGVSEGSPAAILAHLLHRLHSRASDKSFGLKTLSAAAQADVRRRMARCGLAASLEHALRLSFGAQDSDPADVTGPTQRMPLLVFAILDHLKVPPPISVTGGAIRACGGQAGVGSTCATDSAVEGQLGLLLTLSKRAAVLTRALEAASDIADGPTDGQGQERQHMLRSATAVLVLLAEALGQVGAGSWRAEGAQRPDTMARGDGDVNCGATWREDDQGGAPLESEVCADEAQEALALAARAASGLAVPLAWQLVEDITAAVAATESAVKLSLPQEFGATAVCQLLSRMARWWHGPMQQLPAAQLLACQPHRVLAAACALAAAVPVDERIKPVLVDGVIEAVVGVSAHRALSGRVRVWLAPMPLPVPEADSGDENGSSSNNTGGGGGGGGNGSGLDTCAGCLAEPLQLVVRHALGLVPHRAAQALALLKIASGEIRRPMGGRPSCAGGSDTAAEAPTPMEREGAAGASATVADAAGADAGVPDAGGADVKGAGAEGADVKGAGAEGADVKGAAAEGADATVIDAEVAMEANGGFRSCAAAMAGAVCEGPGDPRAPEAENPVLPDGSRPSDLLQAYRDAQGQLPQPPPPSAPSEPLPRKLLLPSCRTAALPRLRMCSNPRCSNFEGRSERDLPLKQCGGCRAVRYCGAECQRAHWREGHKAECKELVG